MINIKQSLLITSAILLFKLFSPGVQAATKAATELANGISDKEIAAVVKKARAAFYIPGMSVGIVHKNKVVHLQGYGIKEMNTKDKVDQHTYFRLASTSKAFTAASLAILVDDGKINWQDKVTDYLPNFKMQDHWVTGEFTIEDLLTHKSGLVSSAGDSMLWPEPSGFTRAEIITNLRHLSPEYSFRSKYAYSNLMYITAGELVAKVSGMPWADFVALRIFKPLKMNCFAGDMPEIALKNVAIPHGERNGKLFKIPRNGINGQALVSAAAGGIVCNASSMISWLQTFLETKNNQTDNAAFSFKQLTNMWQAHTILPLAKEEAVRNNSHFKTYGLAWRKSDFLGYELISHTGTLSGMQAYVALIPELALGVVLLNNGDNSGARAAVMQTILRSFIPDAKQVDWVVDYKRERAEKRRKYLAKHKTPKGSGKTILPNKAYAGTFQDTWFGNIVINNTSKGLRVSSAKMSTLQGSLEPFNDHSFVIRWDNKNAASDAFIHFKLDVEGKVSNFDLTPFKREVSNNHEYRDMHFVKVAPIE
ncbi:MAG: serine hydrolase [Colwellia sp.]|nr:serine hydrolase [Colwellia sp.]